MLRTGCNCALGRDVFGTIGPPVGIPGRAAADRSTEPPGLVAAIISMEIIDIDLTDPRDHGPAVAPQPATTLRITATRLPYPAVIISDYSSLKKITTDYYYYTILVIINKKSNNNNDHGGTVAGRWRDVPSQES